MKTVKEIYINLRERTYYRRTNPCPIFASYSELICIKDCPFATANLDCFLYDALGGFSSKEVYIKAMIKLFPSLLLEEENK